MRRPSAAFAIVLACATLGAGCGAAAEEAPEFEGAEAQVADVIEDLQTAAEENAPRRVCTQLLSRELAGRLGDRCTSAIDQAFDEADTSQLRVEDVTIDGDEATVRVSATDAEGADNDEVIELVREDGAWRISAFGAAG
jgi:hypothetical protein